MKGARAMPAAHEGDSCPACGAPLAGQRPWHRHGGWTVVRCRACGSGATRPLPEPAALRRLYDDTYYTSHGIHHEGILPDHRARARVVREWAPGPRLLELGTGEGYLLAALSDEGFDVYGCEISGAAAAAARARFGLEIFHGELVDAGLPSASFDVVLMFHVLEHVPEPETLMREVHRVLRPAGLAIVEVPNLKSAQMWWPAGRRHILDLPYHLVHFTPAGLRALLERTGFRVAELTIPFGPPLAPILSLYERIRDTLHASSRKAAAGMGAGGAGEWPALAAAAPHGARAGGARIGAAPGWKRRVLAALRRVSSAYKMTAYAVRGDGV